MNATFFSIKVFGIYSAVMGLVLLLVPHVFLPLFNLPTEGAEWIRLLGFVLMCSAYYYIRSALKRNVDFAVYTIHTRIAAVFIVLALFLTGAVKATFLPFGLVDGLGGLWTLLTYQKEMKKMKQR